MTVRGSTPDQVSVERYSVLLVEDDPEDAILVREFLAEAGDPFELVHVEKLGEALDRVAHGHVSCVLLDLGLPDVTGLDGLRALLELRDCPAVCVLTGHADEQRGIEAVGVGAQDYLIKDQVDGALLVKAVRFAVERRRSEYQHLRLRDAERRQAESTRLERGLLPRPLLLNSGLRVTSFYRPGRQRALVGGDFYDVVERPAGVFNIIIGDVCGHGVDEAALGAVLRGAWRALVLAAVPEPEILPALQGMLVAERHQDSLFTTACTVRLDLGRRHATVRMAGHAPPILNRERVLADNRPDLPLGVRDNAVWRPRHIDLPVGWSIMLYTDGLFEGGAGTGEQLWVDGLIELIHQERAAAVPDLPRRLVERAELLNQGPLPDDVAILLLDEPGART